MTIPSILLAISIYAAASAVIVGYGLLQFVIAPVAIKLHTRKGWFESFVYEGIHAESTLSVLRKESNDKLVEWILKGIKFSKYTIVVSICIFIISAILNVTIQ